jgi:hypothetical protein
VWARVCGFGITIILHHIIISFRITLHHTSYRINSKKTEYEANPRQYFRKYVFIGLAKEGASFFTKHEKKGRCFFAEGSKTVCA